MTKALTQRLLTVAIGAPIALAVVLYLPGDLAFPLFFLVFFLAAVEFLRIARAFAPSAPLGSLLALTPLVAAGAFFLCRHGGGTDDLGFWAILGPGVLVTVTTCIILFSRTEVREGMVAVGVLTFAVPYFALPPVALYLLQRLDPWLVVLLLAIVWLGDSAAFFVGRAVGRHKLARVVSPNKSWEGAAASLAAAVLAAAAWSWLRLGQVGWELLAVAAVTSAAAQVGDLVESLFKRGAGVKDSSRLLPGHGGFYDRLDAMFLATPIFLAGLHLLGVDGLIPR